jgi:cob(I)alamin adenosyltransferase
VTGFFSAKGDDGYTGLLGEGRVPKYHPRTEAVGTLDEATAALGLARAICQAEGTASLLLAIQRDLYQVMAEIAATPENAARFRTIDAARVEWLEAQVQEIATLVQPPREFIVPGDSQAGGALSLGRAVIRRAERRVAQLVHEKELENIQLLRYLNRLSSLVFALELLENAAAGKEKPTLVKDQPAV